MTEVETLRSVLCDPDGKCCITGLPADHDIVDRALVNLETEIAELKRQLEEAKDSEALAISARSQFEKMLHKQAETISGFEKQLAESQAREARLREFIGDVSKQTPEKPDYWSSCSQCEHNSSEAEDFIALPHDDTALKEYHDSIVEKCAVIAGNSCLVPPDGGSPTVDEAAVSEEAARRIRTMRTT